jgi:hypothetical protein
MQLLNYWWLSYIWPCRDCVSCCRLLPKAVELCAILRFELSAARAPHRHGQRAVPLSLSLSVHRSGPTWDSGARSAWWCCLMRSMYDGTSSGAGMCSGSETDAAGDGQRREASVTVGEVRPFTYIATPCVRYTLLLLPNLLSCMLCDGYFSFLDLHRDWSQVSLMFSRSTYIFGCVLDF